MRNAIVTTVATLALTVGLASPALATTGHHHPARSHRHTRVHLVRPTAAQSARAKKDLSDFCFYASAGTGIASEHPRWLASICQGAHSQPQAAALRTCYVAVEAGRPVTPACIADVERGALFADLDEPEVPLWQQELDRRLGIPLFAC